MRACLCIIVNTINVVSFWQCFDSESRGIIIRT